MTQSLVITLAQESFLVAIKLAAPPLVVALIVGLLISLLQAMTQIQEMTLAIIPKIMAVILVFIVLMPWFLSIATDFMRTILVNLPNYIGFPS